MNERALIKYLVAFKKREGFGPTISQICIHFKIDRGNVFNALTRLWAKGFLQTGNGKLKEVVANWQELEAEKEVQQPDKVLQRRQILQYVKKHPGSYAEIAKGLTTDYATMRMRLIKLTKDGYLKKKGSVIMVK